MRRLLSAMGAFILLLAIFPTSTAQAEAEPAIRVVDGADSGPGTLRAALQAANGNARIVIEVDEITVESTLVYSGDEALWIKGNGATITAAGALSGPVLSSNGGANFRLSDVEILNATDAALKVDVPPTATTNVRVHLEEVEVFSANSTGTIQVNDLNEAPAGVVLVATDLVLGGSSQFGVLVNETGDGNLIAKIDDSFLAGSSDDLISLNESGPGRVGTRVSASALTGLGFADRFVTGVAIRELDGGDILFTTDGSTVIALGDAFSIRESGSGHIIGSAESTAIVNSTSGYALSETDNGFIRFTAQDVITNNLRGTGVHVVEDGQGSVGVDLIRSPITDSSGSGVLISEADGGNLDATIGPDSTITGHDGVGVSATQTGAGTGVLNIDPTATISDNGQDDVRTEGVGTFKLNVFHINDHHSHLDADDITLDLNGTPVEFELGGFPRVVAMFEKLMDRNANENNATVLAGDAITGTLYYSLFKGEADAAMMNEVCFDMMALGNHEFDDSDAGLANFLDFLNADPDCETEILAANVVPAIGTPLAPTSPTDYIKPYTIETYADGTQVGFVGIDISQKTQVSSSPLDTTQFLDEIETAQSVIDELTADGIDKIVLVTHIGYNNDLNLASMVSGVDAIIGGDSHSLLGNRFTRFGLSAEGDFPTITQDASGNTVCVVQAWQYSNVVGELNLAFNDDGTIASCGGTPYLMLGEVLDDGGLSAAEIGRVIASNAILEQTTPDADAIAVLDQYAAQVDVLSNTTIGQAADDLCVARFPFDGGRSQICGDADLPNGGEVQQVVTDAFLARAFRADLALQNSGGVRVDIPAGDITIAKAYEVLPFANTLFELELTGAEVVLALEQGLGNVLDNGGSSGAYPYGSGIRWDVDVSQSFGNRFSNIEVRPKGETDFGPIELDRTYVVVANSFMASGGDGYQILADANSEGRGVDTGLDYAQSFIDWIEQDQAGVVNEPTEFSTQNYTDSAVPQ